MNMVQNMGTVDRALRALVAIVILALVALKMITSTVAIVLAVVAVIFIATSLISFCPLYVIFGIRTCPMKK